MGLWHQRDQGFGKRQPVVCCQLQDYEYALQAPEVVKVNEAKRVVSVGVKLLAA